jgi:hypothetical protein
MSVYVHKRLGFKVRPTRSPDLSPVGVHLWGHVQTLVCSSPIGDEEKPHQRTFVACLTIRNLPGHFRGGKYSDQCALNAQRRVPDMKLGLAYTRPRKE